MRFKQYGDDFDDNARKKIKGVLFSEGYIVSTKKMNYAIYLKIEPDTELGFINPASAHGTDPFFKAELHPKENKHIQHIKGIIDSVTSSL